MRSAQLDREVRLERRHPETDSEGQVVDRWSTVATVWARMEQLGGSRGLGKEQWVADGDVRFTIRWRDDVTTQDRIVYGGREYEIVTTAEVGRRQELAIVARARAEQREDREGT